MKRSNAMAVLTCALGMMFAGCGGGYDTDNSVNPLVATWTWIQSVWTGPGIAGGSRTFTSAIFQGYGATFSLVVVARDDGTMTASLNADNVSSGDASATQDGTWSAYGDQLTLTANGVSITIPYQLDENTLTVTATTAQLLQITGQTLPAVYQQFGDAQVTGTFTK